MNKKSLSSSFASIISTDIPQDHKRLKALLDFKLINGEAIPMEGGMGNTQAAGSKTRSNLLTNLKDIEDDLQAIFMDKDLDPEVKTKSGISYNTFATVMYIPRKSIYYNACKGCKKKIILDGDDEWRCEKCGTKSTEPEARFMGKAKIMDHTSSIYAKIMNEKIGMTIYGKSAFEIREMVEGENADSDILNNTLNSRAFEEFYLTLRCKENTYMGETKIDYEIIRCENPASNYQKPIASLIEAIQAYDKSII